MYFAWVILIGDFTGLQLARTIGVTNANRLIVKRKFFCFYLITHKLIRHQLVYIDYRFVFLRIILYQPSTSASCSENCFSVSSCITNF